MTKNRHLQDAAKHLQIPVLVAVWRGIAGVHHGRRKKFIYGK
jgi:hypothetical protein